MLGILYFCLDFKPGCLEHEWRAQDRAHHGQPARPECGDERGPDEPEADAQAGAAGGLDGVLSVGDGHVCPNDSTPVAPRLLSECSLRLNPKSHESVTVRPIMIQQPRDCVIDVCRLAGSTPAC